MVKNNPMSARQTINRLLALKLSKWAIAKHLGVRWGTLHNWHRGANSPSPENAAALRALYAERKANS